MKPFKTFDNLPEEKQTRITAISIAEFSQKGYSGTTIGSLAKKIGIAKGSIFQYFGDKEGIFLFIFGKSMGMVKDHLRKERDRSKEVALFTRMETTLLAAVDFTEQHPDIYRLYVNILTESKTPFRNELLSSIRCQSIGFIKSILDDARGRKEVREDINLNRASFIIDAVVDRFLQTRIVPELFTGTISDQKNKTLWVKELVDILRYGMGADKA